MKEAILNFASMSGNRKVAILGDMLELGNDSFREHESITQLVAQQGFEKAVFVGSEFKMAAQSLGFRHFQDVQELKQWFEEQHFSDYQFLIKGSRGIKLEALLDN